MTKQEFDELYVGEKIAVNCETLEESVEFLKLADSFGYRWLDGSRYISANNHWEIYKKKTCYTLWFGVFGNTTLYKKEGYKIVKYKLNYNLGFGLITIKELQKEIHKNAVEHGWWETDRPFGELIALVHSELSEALEDYRDGKPMNENEYPNGKPCGIPSELADVVIRVMDMAERYGIDLEQAILEKHEYNKSRPYKHGGKKI